MTCTHPVYIPQEIQPRHPKSSTQQYQKDNLAMAIASAQAAASSLISEIAQLRAPSSIPPHLVHNSAVDRAILLDLLQENSQPLTQVNIQLSKIMSLVTGELGTPLTQPRHPGLPPATWDPVSASTYPDSYYPLSCTCSGRGKGFARYDNYSPPRGGSRDVYPAFSSQRRNSPFSKHASFQGSAHAHPRVISRRSDLTNTEQDSLDDIIDSLLAQRPNVTGAEALRATSDEKDQFFSSVFRGWNSGMVVPPHKTWKAYAQRTEWVRNELALRIGTLNAEAVVPAGGMMKVDGEPGRETSLPLHDKATSRLIVYISPSLTTPSSTPTPALPIQITDALSRDLSPYHQHIIPDSGVSLDIHRAAYATWCVNDQLILRENGNFNLAVAVHYARRHIKSLVATGNGGRRAYSVGTGKKDVGFKERRMEVDLTDEMMMMDMDGRNESGRGGNGIRGGGEDVTEFAERIPAGLLMEMRLRIDDVGFGVPGWVLGRYRPTFVM